MSAVGDARRELSRAQWVLLAILGTTAFFDGYDRSIVTLALKQIRDGFSLSQSEASVWLSVLYLGALPALLLSRWSDRVGRRRLLLVSFAGYTVATGATALAPNMATFVACQFVARCFLNAEVAVIWTMTAEELPAKARGFGFGVLGMMSALGTGFGAILFGGLIDPIGASWRWMYVVGLPPLVGIGLLRQRLPESRRFERARREGRLAPRWQEIVSPAHRRALLLVVSTAFLFELTTQASIFGLDFLQSDRGLSATSANFMLVAAGLPGIPIMVAAGALSDRFGRRAVGCAAGLFGLAGGMGFFWLPGGIPVLLPCFMAVTVGSMASWPVLSGYATELFPTRLRGQAGAWSAVAKVTGDSASFGLGGVLVALTGALPWSATLLALGPLAGILIVWTMFPDTHGRELEDISGDGVGDATGEELSAGLPAAPPVG